MLDVILVVVVGRAFYALAVEHKKNPWPFAIMGALSGYVGIILGGFIVGIVGELLSPGFAETSSPFVLGLIAIPFGFLSCWLLYVLLKRSWSKPKESSSATLDSDLIDNDRRKDEHRYNQHER